MAPVGDPGAQVARLDRLRVEHRAVGERALRLLEVASQQRDDAELDDRAALLLVDRQRLPERGLRLPEIVEGRIAARQPDPADLHPGAVAARIDAGERL